ncbi:lysophospholipid acyltransferase family protein [Prosthecomicrobium pneumaticum]|uniref:1-acyl-sn-glycerol-3-phosphate acyltransferase n=1 Tax=Prosthecomicrobium pneumaticum TaxID=81895 RepID=A0A7W9FQK0_9HYPH|nr:lysophospholipid acyltransferase family protein [Prosthecomicrobium pneumaticum]MBB5754966.1 1-acyl-sn-glycerol-3-phosphate acyltransferase [Prosthecomicrobium pneumaticum]
MIVLRSALYHIGFYVIMAAIFAVTLPFFFFLPHGAAMRVVRFWSASSVWWLRVAAGLRLELRGLDKLPPGGAILAAKHQAAIETFALVPLFADPTYVMKRELMRIPLFGWYTWKAGMIPVDRAGGAKALRALAARVRAAVEAGRQVIIFPEGTRRPPGAPPDYKPGVMLLYRETGLPVFPVALNTGLYWPRTSLRRYPGTMVIEILDPIPPGLDAKRFGRELQARIEPASDRLIAEAAASARPPPIPPEAAARLAALSPA